MQLKSYLFFLFIFLFTTGGSIFFLKYSYKKSFLQKPFEKEMIPKRKRIINFTVRWFMRCVAALMFYYYVLPFGLDLPRVISGNYETIAGYVTAIDARRGRYGLPQQKITIDNEYDFYNFTLPRVEKDEKLTIIYLPNSKFVVEIIK